MQINNAWESAKEPGNLGHAHWKTEPLAEASEKEKSPLQSYTRPVPICHCHRLAAVLGLDQLTDSLVASLAAGSGVQRPSPAGSAAEAKEVAALSALVTLAASKEAGFLGTAWVTIMRTLSALDLLKVAIPLSQLLNWRPERTIPAIWLFKQL